MREIKRGDFVKWRTWAGQHTVEGIVRRAHRDGSCTVEARFMHDMAGRRQGCYLGYKYRFGRSDIKRLEISNADA